MNVKVSFCAYAVRFAVFLLFAGLKRWTLQQTETEVSLNQKAPQGGCGHRHQHARIR